MGDGLTAGRFAEDRHLGWIAAEGGDVVAHPSERRDLIEGPVIAGDAVLRLRAQGGMGEVSDQTQAIVESDEDDASLRQGVALVEIVRPAPGLMATAVNPHHDRLLLGPAQIRGPHVQVEAVLALGFFGGEAHRELEQRLAEPSHPLPVDHPPEEVVLVVIALWADGLRIEWRRGSPSQGFTGWGGFQRNSPTGGAA